MIDSNSYLDEKIKLTNFISKTMGLVGLPFLIFGILKIPFWGYLLILPYMGILMVPFLNRHNYFNYSRFILSLFIPAVAGIFHSLILGNQAQSISGFTTLQFSLLIIPFLIYKTNERPNIILSLVINLCLILLLPYYRFLFKIEIDNTIFFTSGFNFFCYICASILFITPYFNIALTNEQNLKNLRKIDDEKKIFLKELEKNSFENNILLEFSKLLNNINKNRDRALIEALNFLSSIFNISVSFIYMQGYDENGLEHLKEIASYGKSKSNNYDWTTSQKNNLVIECFVKNEDFFIKDVMPEHLRIYSALGESMPIEVRIIVLKSNELKIGVLEAGFYKNLNADEEIVFYKCTEQLSFALLSHFSEEANKEILKELYKAKSES